MRSTETLLHIRTTQCYIPGDVRWGLWPHSMARPPCGWRNGLQLCMLAANILNNQPRTNDKGWSSSMRVGLTNLHRKKLTCTKTSKEPRTWKEPLGRPRRRWVDTIRVDLGEVGWGDVDWICLAKGRKRWRALVNSVLNLRVSWNAWKLSSGLTSSGLSSSAQLHS
jgi:hypothetical protein